MFSEAIDVVEHAEVAMFESLRGRRVKVRIVCRWFSELQLEARWRWFPAKGKTSDLIRCRRSILWGFNYTDKLLDVICWNIIPAP